MSIKSYTNDLIGTFENINMFLFINLEVTSMVVFPFMAIDLILLYSFLLKSIFVLIFLFLIASVDFISKFFLFSTSVSFLFFFLFSPYF